MPPIKIGIIGTGQISPVYVEGYRKLDDVNVYAVCDVREEVAMERALAWGASRCYLDYNELLADPDIDAVEILTPHHLHEEIALAAAAAGKHIHLAKPIALGIRAADRVIAAADRAGVILQVSEPTVFYQPIREAKAFIEGGEIGTPISIRMKAVIGSPDGGWAVEPDSWMWRLDPARAGGGPLLFDIGYHRLAAALHLMGAVERVNCWVARTEIHSGYFLDTPTLVTWKHFGPNRFGSLELVYAPQLYVRSDTYPHIETLEVTGSRGILYVNRAAARTTDQSALQLYRDGRVFSFNEIDDDWRKAFHASVANFVKSIRGQSKPRLSGAEAKQVLRLALAARDAAKHSGSVAVGS